MCLNIIIKKPRTCRIISVSRRQVFYYNVFIFRILLIHRYLINSHTWMYICVSVYTNNISIYYLLLEIKIGALLELSQEVIIMAFCLISSLDGSSHCIVDFGDLICDDETVEIGDTITYIYNRASYQGKLIERSGKKNNICIRNVLRIINFIARRFKMIPIR